MRWAAQLLEQRGQVPTRAKMLVLIVLRRSNVRHLTVERLCAAMLALPEHVAISSFQRALYTMTACGLVSRGTLLHGADSRHYYELSDRPPHHHMVCTECHAFHEFADPQLDALERRVMENHGFLHVHTDFAGTGLCQQCTRRKQRDRSP